MKVSDLCPRCFREAIHNGQCSNCQYSAFSAKKDIFAVPPFTVLHNRYIIGEVLGAGGFGITYLSYDMQLQQRKAIKECFPRSFATRSGTRVVPYNKPELFNLALSKFYDEARILVSLGGIKSVVRADEVFQENGTAYLVMEYVDGVSLKDVCVSSGGTVDFETAKTQFIALALTLDEVHLHSLLHRDVSPHNIMLLPGGRIKLLDFGAARYITNLENKSQSIVLKPGFAPPEQYATHGNQGPWTDIYGLACTIYWYLTGKKVPEAPARQLGTNVEALYLLRPDVERRFANILAKAMALDYRYRHQSISELLEDTENALGNITVLDSPYYSSSKEESWLDKLLRELKEKLNHPKAIIPEENKMYIVQMEGGPFDGYIYAFPDNGLLVLGRSKDLCNGVLPNVNCLSRLHCSLRLENGNISIIDHSSTGTFVGGRKLARDHPARLNEGDTFWLADPMYTFRILRIDK